MAGAVHVAGEAGPDQGDDGAVAVVGVDAGPSDLDEVGADRGEGREVELAFGVEAAGDGRALRGQQPVGADDLLGLFLDDEEVVAVGVEGVGVEARLGAVEAGAELSGEHQVAQALGGAHLVLAAGEADGVAGVAGRAAGAVTGAAAGTGAGVTGVMVEGGRVDGDRGAMVIAAPDPGTGVRPAGVPSWLLYFFRDRLDST